MFKTYEINKEEEEKTEYFDKNNYNDNTNNIHSNNKKLVQKKNHIFTGLNTSTKSLRNNYEKYKRGFFEIHSINLNEPNINNSITKTNKIKDYKNTKEININKDELYNAFILFQKLLLKGNYKNKNEEYIKTKLFDFILEKKNININKNINENSRNNLEKNKNIFITNYLRSYSKPFIHCHSIQNKNKEIQKSSSFSYFIKQKSGYLNNYFDLLDEDEKNTPKSVSLIFDEYLLSANKTKNKMDSHNNSKYSNHEYSFDLKNKEKNEISFQSIPDKEKANNKSIDSHDNYNIYDKEFGNKNLFGNKSEKTLKNDFPKYIFTEDLLIEKNLNIKEKLNLMDLNSARENEICEDLGKNLFNNGLFEEKIKISPSKKYKEESYIQKDNFKIKERESIIEVEKTTSSINEIKVNKNKILYNKENLITEKIKELDEEIKHFREESKKVELIKEEYEKLKMNLLKDIKEFNLKKQIQQKYFGNDYERLKVMPKNETKLIMNITQQNQALILNNDKKTEIINLLKKRIYQLENIIKNKNKNCQENKKIHKSIINSIRENNLNILIKKKNDIKKKNNNNNYSLKRRNTNLKKNIRTYSMEKLKEKNKNDNIFHDINKNMNLNNLNKLYFDGKKIKKSINASYSEQQNIKNTKNLNLNNLNSNTNKIIDVNPKGYNLKTIESFSNKNTHYSNTIKRNINNSKIPGGNAKFEHPNLCIYEKLIKNEKERDNKYNKIKININSVRDLGEHKKIMKKLKTEFHNNEKFSEKNKRTINNNNFNESKNILKNFQRSQEKKLLLKRIELKMDINKNKNNSNIFGLDKVKKKNNKIKNIVSEERNIIDKIKSEKISPNIILRKNQEKNNSIDNKDIINNNNNFEFENDDNIEGYDFVIPEKYRFKDNGKIINSINSDGKIINIYEDNKKEIIFKSGVRKEVFSDGYQLIHFPNGDMKQKFVGKDEKVIYFYNETNTVQTTLKNGINIFKFNNGQIEKHYPDGSKYIFYTNGLRRKISKNGTEETFNFEEANKSQENLNK